MKKSESGIIMLWVLLVVMSAWIMGMVLVSIALSNSKLKIIGWQAKQNFYECEGALEGVRAAVSNEIQKAFEAGWSRVDSFMEEEYEDFIDSEIEKEMCGIESPYINTERYDDGGVRFLIDREAVDELLNQIFKKEYSDYFCKTNKAGFVKTVEDVELDGVNINLIDDYLLNKNEEILFDVSSSRKFRETDVRIDVKFAIAIPDRDYGHIEYSERFTSLPEALKFDIISPCAIEPAEYILGDANILVDEHMALELAEKMTKGNEILKCEGGILVYVGERDFEIGPQYSKGLVISCGRVSLDCASFEGLVAGMQGVEFKSVALFKRNRELVENILVSNKVENMFQGGCSDAAGYAIAVERLEAPELHGDVEFGKLLQVKQWTRRR